MQLLASYFTGTPLESNITKLTKSIALQSNSVVSTKVTKAINYIATTIIELLFDPGANCFIVNNNKRLHDLISCREIIGVTGGTHAIINCKGTLCLLLTNNTQCLVIQDKKNHTRSQIHMIVFHYSHFINIASKKLFIVLERK